MRGNMISIITNCTDSMAFPL